MSDTPKHDEFNATLARRQRVGKVWGNLFYASNFFAILVLLALAYNIINGAFGYVVLTYATDPDSLSERPLAELNEPELTALLVERVSANRLLVLLRDTLSQVPNNEFTQSALKQVLAGKLFDASLGELTVRDLTPEQVSQILSDNLSLEELQSAIEKQIIAPVIAKSWDLWTSLTQLSSIEAEVAEKFPEGDLVFRSWVNSRFISSSLASTAYDAGLRTALLGTLYVIAITIVFAFPLGLGAAIYLQEYANDSWINRFIELNIRNLAGVPSIIYGMLGLAIFARTLVQLTSGAFVGAVPEGASPNGRTVISAGLTLGLLILPVIIIQAQEAIKAVPKSLREASYGLGGTKWQTVSRSVLPVAFPSILTGIILSLSRAIGETAPLIVVGASTFLSTDPNGIFSKFTVVPIQIYTWTQRPEAEFRAAAAAAIIILMALLLSINSVAIYLRNRYSRSY